MKHLINHLPQAIAHPQRQRLSRRHLLNNSPHINRQHQLYPPVKSSQREYYLRQAESYQRQANSALDSANSYLQSANFYLSLVTAYPTSPSRDYYRRQAQRDMEDYQRELANYTSYQNTAMEYMLKAQREP